MGVFFAHSGISRQLDFDRLSQLASARYGAEARQMVERWQDLLTIGKLSEMEKVRRVNDFFNRRISYAEDIEIWGQSDYWATPLEVMSRGLADCEDFATSKYFSLLQMGVPADRLRITYVKARIGGMHSKVVIAHMVLGYYPDRSGEPMILDNLIDEIRPASRRLDLTPVFSFNSEGLWVGVTQGKQSNGSPTARLSRWRDLLVRMKADGFE
jgi:predicted transglutaminase-like cysteine proteinase